MGFEFLAQNKDQRQVVLKAIFLCYVSKRAGIFFHYLSNYYVLKTIQIPESFIRYTQLKFKM